MVLIWPIAFINAIYQYIRFKKTLKILHRAVNSDNDFYNFLEQHEYMPDWLGRLYSVQPIPKIFKDFTEDELYDVVMRSIRGTLVPIFERTNIIDVGAVTVERMNEESYIMTITTFWQSKFFKSLRILIWSFIIWVSAVIVYIFFMN